MRRWLPFKWTPTSVNVKPIHYPPYGDLHELNPLYGRLRYICKGVDPAEAIYDIVPKFQGEIYGQRYGISKSLR